MELMIRHIIKYFSLALAFDQLSMCTFTNEHITCDDNCNVWYVSVVMDRGSQHLIYLHIMWPRWAGRRMEGRRVNITVTSHERRGVSNHWPFDYLFKNFFRLTARKKKEKKVRRLWGELVVCEGNHRWPVDSFHKNSLIVKCKITTAHILVRLFDLYIYGTGTRGVNAMILVIEPLGTNSNEILIEIHIFSFNKIHLKMSSGKWRPFCLVVRRAGLLWSQQDFEWRWSVPLFKCLTVLEFSFILFDLCLLITFFNFIMNYVPIVTFWIFTYHKIWILSIMFCSIWSYWIIYFLACLEVSWRVVS